MASLSFFLLLVDQHLEGHGQPASIVKPVNGIPRDARLPEDREFDADAAFRLERVLAVRRKGEDQRKLAVDTVEMTKTGPGFRVPEKEESPLGARISRAPPPKGRSGTPERELRTTSLRTGRTGRCLYQCMMELAPEGPG
jgi:hypothetical protein